MNCPYCTEKIKDEAIVCGHCQRDLAFFKPLDKKLEAIDSQLGALTEVISKISAHLDRRPAEGNENSEAKAPVVKLKKPTVWRMLLMVLFQLLLTIVLTGGLVGFLIDLQPVPSSLETTGTNEERRQQLATMIEAQRQDDEQFNHRQGVLLKIYLAAVCALPIFLGLRIGLRWQGTNLKRYLLVGLLCGLVDGAIVAAIFIPVVLRYGHTPGDFSFVALFMLIDLSRCILGFATGGLLGDWLERRRYPELHGRSFSDLMALKAANRGVRVGGFGRMTQGLGSLTSSLAPMVPLIGLIITSVFGFYAARAKTAPGDKEKDTSADVKVVGSSPTPSPQPTAR